MTRPHLKIPWLCAGFAFTLLSCDQQVVPETKAYQVTSKNQLIGGPSALADLGDFILENDKVRVAILGSQAANGTQLYSLGPGLYGGSLVDADLKRPETEYQNGKGLDQFAEIFPTINLKITGTSKVEVVKDGSDGGEAVVRMSGASEPYFTLLELLDLLCIPPSNGQFVTDYILEPGKSYIKMVTTAMLDKDDVPITATDVALESVVPGENPMPPLAGSVGVVDYYQKGGLIIGEFLLMGGDVDIFAPSIGFDEDGAVALNPNTLVEPFALEYIAAVGDKVSYGYVGPKGGLVSVPLFTASQTAAFPAALDEPDWEGRVNYTAIRYFVIGEGDVASIVDAMLEIQELPAGRLEGHVTDARTGQPVPKTHVFVYYDRRPEDSTGAIDPSELKREDIYSEFLTDRGSDKQLDGSFAGNLPPGRWILMAKDGDRPGSDPLAVTVVEGQTTRVSLVAKGFGNFSFTIRDQNGQLIPAKLSFKAADGSFQADPVLGESRQSGGFSKVYFSPTGDEIIPLRPGKYQVMVTRGIEYSLYDSATDPRYPYGYITVPELGAVAGSVHLDVTLNREVFTPGFVSADFHVHATNSFDSGIPLETRVLSMAAEGVEFFTGTDHDYITNYQPVIRKMGLTPFVSSAVGLEVTTLELGHLIGFPLDFKADQRAGGALDWSYLSPSEMISGIKNLGLYGPDQTVAMVAHPRDGILGYFDVYGYNPWTEVVDPVSDSDFAIRSISDLNLYLELLRINPLMDHDLFTLDFDTLEILNSKRMDLIHSATYEEMQAIQDAAEWDPEAKAFRIDDPYWMYQIIERTTEEQEALDKGEADGGMGLNVDFRRGQIDDWFNLLNYGYRISAVGNSDTHGMTSTEAGCPRTYVQSSSDEPGALDPREISESVKLSRAMPTYGPFIEMLANGQYGIGSRFSVRDTGGKVTLDFSVQSASWIHLKRVELYENGRMIRSFAIDETKTAPVKLEESIELTPKKDSWYILAAMGDQDLSPVFQAVELPYIELDAIIEEALRALNNENCANLFGAPPVFPKKYPVFPFGFTNPIWVDVDGDRDGDGDVWEAPGHADWMRLDSRALNIPVEPAE